MRACPFSSQPSKYLFTLTIYSYAAMIVLFSEGLRSTFAISIFYCTCTVYYIYNFYILASNGQEMTEAQNETKEELEEFYFGHHNHWSAETRNKICLLMTKISRPKPMTPLGFFTLSKSGFLSSIALVFTYLIVLLQFRTT